MIKISSFSTLVLSVCTVAVMGAPAYAKSMDDGAKFSTAPSATPASLPTVSPGPRLIGELETTTAKYEDTLVHLARKYNVGFVELRAANPGVDPWLPGAGTHLIIPTQHIVPAGPQEGIVINLPEMRLYYYMNPGEPPATFPIGIGRTGLTTPLGTTTIARMTADPIWFPTERMRKEDPTLPVAVPPGPENPMGTHAMYLGWPSYAIHGTDKPYSIGRRLSSGCIRMYPEDILTVFDYAHPGTHVTVVDQPVKTAWIENKYYIQVHPTQEQSDVLSHDAAHKPEYPLSDADIKTILMGAGADADALDWTKIRKAVRERRGIPIIVADRDDKPSSSSNKVREELLNQDKATTDVQPDAKVNTKSTKAQTKKKTDVVKLKSDTPPETKKTDAKKPPVKDEAREAQPVKKPKD